MKKEFLNLGRQPIANKFLKEDEIKDEFFFDLKVVSGSMFSLSKISKSY